MLLKLARAATSTRLCCCVALLFGTSSATRAADPTSSQQYWLELMNRMRMNPAAELELLTNYSIPGSAFASPSSDNSDVAAALQYYGTSASLLASQWSTLVAAPALAWNGVLSNSAATYSDVMVDEDQQAHDLDGLDLNTRVENAGYGTNYLDLGETLFATSQSPFHGHAAFAIDWGDDDSNPGNGFGTGIQNPAYHRIFMMDPIFKEVGIGYQTQSLAGNTNVTGPIVVTQHFGNHYRYTGSAFVADAFLTGSVYEESVLADNFYTPGEGLGGRAVFIYDNATNALLKTGTTNSAGGYNILLDGLVNGVTYRVEVPSTGLAPQTFTINARVETYQDELGNDVSVTFYDNAYARFQVVPEPGGALLIASSALMWLAHRQRRRAVTH